MPLLSDKIGRRPTDLILFGVSLGLSAAFLFARGWAVVAVYAGLTFCYSALAACDAINVAMRELFLQIVYGRSQTAFL